MGCGSAVNGTRLLCRAARRTAMSPFDALSRRSVRAAAVSPPFPLGGVLPLHCLRRGQALFVRPLLGYYDPVRILIRVHVHRSAVAFMNRPGLPVPTRMRLPRAKNFSTCTRSPTARGSSHASHSPWDDVASLSQNKIGTSELDPFRSSILRPWPPL